MVNISMKAMLEAGVHFGHQTRRWNPKMAKYIFGERNNIHIIDLQKTVKELKKAYLFAKDQSAQGKRFLFVGTKKQAQEILKTEAERCNAAYVHNKWLGGCLTNFSTIRKSIGRLEELERWERDGLFKVLSKKEVSRLTKEMNRLKKLLTGIRHLTELPQVVFVVDPMEEEGTVLEARKLNIPVVAVCDTNCDPDLITYPIPGNDDAARSIKLFCGLIADAVLEGKETTQKTGTEPSKTEGEAVPALEEVLPIEEPTNSTPPFAAEETPADGESLMGAPAQEESHHVS